RIVAADWNVKPVLREMLGSRMFFSEFAYRCKIKSPAELAVGAALMIGGKVSCAFLRDEIGLMGQSLLLPPTVKGWDGEQAWINSSTVLTRFNLGLSLAAPRKANDFARRPDLEAWLKQHHAESASDVVDSYARLMF